MDGIQSNVQAQVVKVDLVSVTQMIQPHESIAITQGQVDPEHRTLSEFAGQRHISTELLNNPIDNRQLESSSVSIVCVEWLPNSRLCVSVNSLTVVFDLQNCNRLITQLSTVV